MEVVFVRWLKAEGDEVAVGDPLFEVDTEKAVMEVEAYAAGTLERPAVREGDIVQTRQVIARILAPGEQRSQPAARSHQRQPLLHRAGRPGPSSPPPRSRRPAPVRSGGRARSQARRGQPARAARGQEAGRRHSTACVGTGPDGLITEADVRAAAEQRRLAVAGRGAPTPPIARAAPSPT